jgi:hypothetical protein
VNYRFRLPDPVLDVAEDDRESWGNDVLLAVRDVGSFIRVLLPVQLAGGYTITFGTWVGVRPETLRHAYKVWWKPQYANLEFDGFLANRLPPWGSSVFGKEAHAAVDDPSQAPRIVRSADSVLSAVLADEWNHETVLSALRT